MMISASLSTVEIPASFLLFILIRLQGFIASNDEKAVQMSAMENCLNEGVDHSKL